VTLGYCALYKYSYLLTYLELRIDWLQRNKGGQCSVSSQNIPMQGRSQVFEKWSGHVVPKCCRKGGGYDFKRQRIQKKFVAEKVVRLWPDGRLRPCNVAVPTCVLGFANHNSPTGFQFRSYAVNTQTLRLYDTSLVRQDKKWRPIPIHAGNLTCSVSVPTK